MRVLLCIVMLWYGGLALMAQDSTAVEQPKKESWLRRTLHGFTYIDERYVEPQHYNWSVMLQATHSYDYFRLKSNSGQSLTFAPSPNLKIGPYFGWRWIFAGYTFDIKNLNVSSNSEKFQIDLSFYAAQIGVDLYYRKTNNNYRVRDVDFGRNVDMRRLEGRDFDGLSVGVTGFNLYYIFNHQRFSYPAAFAQSTCQKISCGSWMAGIGYRENTLLFDHEELEQLVEKYGNTTERLDSSLMFNKVKYFDYNISGGYAYNWVFARNCLFCASLSLALSYKKSKGDTDTEEDQGFSFNNLNLDGIGRFAVVYNNTRWYAGASAIVHSYNYKKSRFSTNNLFGSLNIYVGYNFGARGPYKKSKKVNK